MRNRDKTAEYFELDITTLKLFGGGRKLGEAPLRRTMFTGEPLEPSSPLVSSKGSLVETPIPLSNRLTMVFYSPLTKTGAWLRQAGMQETQWQDSA